MRKEEILILDREDLIISNHNKSFQDIIFQDFKISIEKLYNVGIILFLDADGQTKILKNRYGK
jgi:hypothetical protein